MSHLFEVRVVANRVSATYWRITSCEYIDVDLYLIMNDSIKSFNLVATSIMNSDYFIYEVKFQTGKEIGSVKKMFPGCIVEKIPMKNNNRIFVYYDKENNVYVPFDDPSM